MMQYLILGILIITLPVQWLAIKTGDFILWIEDKVKKDES